MDCAAAPRPRARADAAWRINVARLQPLKLIAVVPIAAGYAIGSVPVAWLAGRATGVDLRERGSGNAGASNVIESVSPLLGVAVGIVQIAQGLLPVLLVRALDQGQGAQIAAGTAAVIANNWNPWLGFTGGRGIGLTLGVLLGTSWAALAAFVFLPFVVGGLTLLGLADTWVDFRRRMASATGG